ncbi:MAG: hypothetical protein ACYCO0_02775 [Candidatus Micrarchaeaceae archaeon]
MKDDSTVNDSGLGTVASKQQYKNQPYFDHWQQSAEKRNTKMYIAAIVVIVIVIAFAYVGISNNKDAYNATAIPVSLLNTMSGRNVVLSGIPLAINMSSYYFHLSNGSSIQHYYSLPFSSGRIIATSFPSSNFTASVPKAYSNISSPIMVFVHVLSYPNITSAESNYRIFSGINKNGTTSHSGMINNSIVYSTTEYGLSLIGIMFQYKNYISITTTWGNPKIFTNSSYASNIAVRQYSIIRNST